MTHEVPEASSKDAANTFWAEKITDVDESHTIEIDVVEDGYDTKLEKIVRRKQDLRIVPLCSIIFLFCFIDRANIGTAPTISPICI